MKWIFISLVALRLIVGFHFFTEGQKKLEQGDWSAAPFFAGAHGPLKPYFQLLLPDADYRSTLCIVDKAAAEPTAEAATDNVVAKPVSYSTEIAIDTEPTFGYWSMFLEDTLVGYKLSQQQIAARIDNLTQQVKDLDASIAELKELGSDDVATLRGKQQELIALINRLNAADPLNDMLDILARRKEQLNDYVTDPVIRSEILKAFEDEKRLKGFVRDGENRDDVALYVESLRGQVDTIENDIKQAKTKHAKAIQGIWDGLESELNQYGASLQSPLESQVTLQNKVELQKPFVAQKSTPLYWINTIVPYFDTTIGVLLLIGLFSRLASLAAAGFLMGIILTQPIWVPGYDAKIIYQIVEFGALLVMAATVAGRYGGLDYFLWSLFGKKPEEPAEDFDLD